MLKIEATMNRLLILDSGSINRNLNQNKLLAIEVPLVNRLTEFRNPIK
jgi:hypothetical protein